MEILIWIGVGVVIYLMLEKAFKWTEAPKVKPLDAELQNQLQQANERGDKFLQELIPLRGLRNQLEARNRTLESLVIVAHEVLLLIWPPSWINEFQFSLTAEGADVRAIHQWASAAALNWSSIDALSADSKRNLEEACLVAMGKASGSDYAKTYSSTPLLQETVRLLKEVPNIIQVNLFELKSNDFQKLALWLDMVNRMGFEQYLRLRALSSNLDLDLERAQALSPDVADETRHS